MEKKTTAKLDETKAAVKAAEAKVAAKVEETKTAAKEATAKVVAKVEETKNAAKETEVKAATKVEEPKKTAAETAKKRKPRTKTAKKAAKEELKPEVYIQYQGREGVVEDAIKKVTEQFVAEDRTAFPSGTIININISKNAGILKDNNTHFFFFSIPDRPFF